MKKTDENTTIQELKDIIDKFITQRDWQQFHSDPKNTLIAVVIELGELLEHFRFTSATEAQKRMIDRNREIEDEIADIFYNLLMFCLENDIDVSRAFANKMAKNYKKYPVKKVKGKNLKYSELAP